MSSGLDSVFNSVQPSFDNDYQEINEQVVNQQSHHQQNSGEFVCLDCRKTYTIRKSYVNHLRSHKYVFTCQYQNCGKKFSYESACNRHKKTHTGEKPYTCQITNCEQKFAQKSNLSRHIRIHFQQKPFICNRCLKKFSTTTNLKQHQLIHAQKKEQRKVYYCTNNGCEKSYLYMCNLRKHLKEHTNTPEYIGEIKPTNHAFTYQVLDCDIKIGVFNKVVDHSETKLTFKNIEGTIQYDPDLLFKDGIYQQTVKKLLQMANQTISVSIEVPNNIDYIKMLHFINEFIGLTTIKKITLILPNQELFKQTVLIMLNYINRQ